MAATGTTSAVIGFIVQFIGLRALHWSATIIQLGVTILMTGIRAYVRRGLTANPICYDMVDGHEPACLTMQLSQEKDEAQASAGAPKPVDKGQGPMSPWTQRLGQVLQLNRSRGSTRSATDPSGRIEGRPQSNALPLPVCAWELTNLRCSLGASESLFETYVI